MATKKKKTNKRKSVLKCDRCKKPRVTLEGFSAVYNSANKSEKLCIDCALKIVTLAFNK